MQLILKLYFTSHSPLCLNTYHLNGFSPFEIISDFRLDGFLRFLDYFPAEKMEPFFPKIIMG